MRKVKNGGGWAAIRYSLKKARQAGGGWKLYRALRSKNTCKTCALGMGGQAGGMVNERGSFPEVCKKSLQAMVSDMQPAITAEFWKQHSIAQLQTWTPRQLEISGRLIQPVLATRGASHFQTTTWMDAFERIASRLRSLEPDESFWYFSGRSSNEAGFLMQLAARMYGTNNVNNCSYYCHQASGVGLNKSLGTGTATVTLDDIEQADLVFVIGGNPASNHPRLMSSLNHVRRRGGKVIVINPVRELGLLRFRIPSDVRSMLFNSEIASHVVQPHIGGDLALLTGLAKAVLESGHVDAPFVHAHCRDAESYLAWLADIDWSELEAKSGVSEPEMREIAAIYSRFAGQHLQLDDGHHAPCARRSKRRSHRQPGLAARHGRPPRGRAHAHSRTFQCAGHRLGGCYPQVKRRDLSRSARALSSRPAHHSGAGHHGLHGTVSGRPAESRYLPGRQSVWIQSR